MIIKIFKYIINIKGRFHNSATFLHYPIVSATRGLFEQMLRLLGMYHQKDNSLFRTYAH